LAKEKRIRRARPTKLPRDPPQKNGVFHRQYQMGKEHQTSRKKEGYVEGGDVGKGKPPFAQLKSNQDQSKGYSQPKENHPLTAGKRGGEFREKNEQDAIAVEVRKREILLKIRMVSKEEQKKNRTNRYKPWRGGISGSRTAVSGE